MTKEELKAILQEEKELYLGKNAKKIKKQKKCHHKRYTIWKYLYYFRKTKFWQCVRTEKGTKRWLKIYSKYAYRYYDKKRNIYSEKSGIEIGINSQIGKNCDIWHSNVVINGIVGDNCVFHGSNIIGNKGANATPILGNNVDIGAGAIIIGDVKLEDGIVVGAGAVVTKSFEISGCVIAGVPAKVLRRGESGA